MTLDKFKQMRHTKSASDNTKSEVGPETTKSAPKTTTEPPPPADDSKETVEAKQVFADPKEEKEYLYREVYFGHSKTPRTVRPANVKLKVGQVVKHKDQLYYGVIVAWDEVAKVRGILLV